MRNGPRHQHVDVALFALAGLFAAACSPGAPARAEEGTVADEPSQRPTSHRVDVAPPGAGFGHAHVIERSEDGLAAATDGRALTGAAAVW
jgi:hypothetical protein